MPVHLIITKAGHRLQLTSLSVHVRVPERRYPSILLECCQERSR
jgi:hypothetical protein